MSEIRILFQQVQQSLNNTVVNSPLSQQLIDTLRVGQNLMTQLVISDKQFWLIIDGVKLSIPKETAEQWQLVENQNIKLKVKSLSNPIELQIIKSAGQTSRYSNATLVDQLSASTKQELSSTQAAKVIESTVTSSIITKQPNIPNKSHARLMESNPLLKDIAKDTSKDTVKDVDKGIERKKQSSDLAKTIPSSKTNDIPISKLLISRTNIQPNVSLRTSRQNESKSKDLTTPLAQQNTKIQAETIVSTKSTDKLPDGKMSESIQNIISASKTVITNNTEQHKRTIMPEQTISQKLNSKNSTEPALSKSQSINTSQPLKIEQPEAKLVPLSVIKEPIKNNTKSTVSNNINQAVTNNQTSTPIQKMKFEIPVNLPDKERFPLLADKLAATFSQIQAGSNNSEKSISELFSQLSRLHRWIAKNKTAGRTNSGAQASKSANDLKESLKDLFRYISHKDTLKTGKSIEKALKQSGTFLERRMATQKEVPIQKRSKPSIELTLHKDIKANLNRVLATALYNLAKINAAQLKSTQAPHPSQSTTTSTGASSTSTNASSAQKALTGGSSSLNNNLLNNIKTKLRQFTAGRATVSNLPELEYITKEVLKNVQEALSRTQLGQLINLRPESSTQQWLFELPVMNDKNVDSFSIYLKEEEDEVGDVESKKRRWSVVLQFEIGELGKIRSMLSWGNNKIQVRFLAERDTTVNLVDTELEYFQKMLNKQGIAFEQLTVEQAQLDDLSVQFSGRTS